MQSSQIIEYIEVLNKELESDEVAKVYKGIRILSAYYNKIYKILNNSLMLAFNENDDARIYSRENASDLNQIKNEIKEQIKPKDFFISLNRIEEKYISFLIAIGLTDKNNLNIIKSVFSSFENRYENFVFNSNYLNALLLVDSATMFQNTLNSIKEILNIVSQSLQENYDYQDQNLGSFSLRLDSDYTFQEFIDKLQSIQSLYSEICFLFDISEIDFPLKTVKVESGSLWVKVFGESKVLEFIMILIKDAKDYTYRNKTTEGKIESVTQKFKTLESVLEVRKKMKDAGLDTKELDEKIQKSSLIIANKLNNLLEGENTIVLNGELIEPINKTQKLLKSNNNYLPETSKDITEDW